MMQQQPNVYCVSRAKEIQALKNRQAALADKKASTLERSTRRRTKFDFDLWDVGSCASRSETGEKLQDSTWLNHNTRMHNLKSTRSLKRKVPQDFRREISTRTKVETPHAGASYNPSYADHQDLLWKAALVEVNKEKAAQKIEYHTTRMFPDAKDAPTMADHIKEMSEGIRELEGDKEEEDDDDEEYEDIESGAEEEEESGGNKKLKTRKQRRKEKEAKADLAVRKRAADDKKKNQDVYRLKSLKKSISVSEAVTATRVVKRLQAKVDKLGEPAKLSKHTFEDADMEIKLSDELTGNLRSLKPEGNLLEDRFKSMQARNVIETRIKTKIVKNPKKRKRLEKRNYKMPWEKDAHGIVKA
jgi:nucleolar protein 53